MKALSFILSLANVRIDLESICCPISKIHQKLWCCNAFVCLFILKYIDLTVYVRRQQGLPKRRYPTTTLHDVTTQRPLNTSPWRWRQQGSPKRRYPTTTPHGDMSLCRLDIYILICTVHQITVGWSKSRRMSWMGRVARMGEMKNGCGNFEGMKSLWRPGHRWKDNIKICLQLVKCHSGFVWPRIGLWLILVNTIMNLRVP
jgi:hypothetical protein